MSADVSPHPFEPIPERPDYCVECFGHEPDPIHHAAELVAEYAAAIERIRDRAQEARAGAVMARHLPHSGPRDLAELTRHARREAADRLRITQADERSPAGPIRWTPIGAAGLAAPRSLALRLDGSCGTCGRPESGHDQRHDLPGSPVLCLA